MQAKRTRHFLRKKKTLLFSYPFGNLKNHRLTIKDPDMIFLLTNVAKTQDVPLDGTIFSSVIPAKRTRPLL